MTEQDLFGESELVADVSTTPGAVDVMARPDDVAVPLDGWISHLQCVDEGLMLRAWRRLLTDEAAVSDIMSDDSLKYLRDAASSGLRVATDTNPSFLAKALVQCSDANRLLPLNESTLRDGQLARVVGSVSTFRTVPKGWTFRISISASSSMLVRFGSEAFLQARPRHFQGSEVVVLAIVDDARKLELSGIALVVRSYA